MSSKKMMQLIPAKIKGYYPDGDAKSVLTKLGTISYSLCERNFVSGNKSIKILLFDFNDAPIMYNQAMRKWSDESRIETDTLVFRPIAMKNCTGWESYRHRNKDSQILLGICNRFFLNISGTNVDLEVLQHVLLQFPLDKFPK
ncbi:MAG: hypothetical protein JNM57_17485 [Cyclobacteriaceae bacterium]|nr:hypothetical protein [Cyclobacteriaceae bacterium]